MNGFITFCQDCGQVIFDYWFHILAGALSMGLTYFLGRLLYKYLHYRWMQVKNFMTSLTNLPTIMDAHSAELKAHEERAKADSEIMKKNTRRLNSKARKIQDDLTALALQTARL